MKLKRKYLELVEKMESSERESKRFERFMHHFNSFRGELTVTLHFAREGDRNVSSSAYLDAANLATHCEADIISGILPIQYEPIVEAMQQSLDRTYDLAVKRLDKIDEKRRGEAMNSGAAA